MFSTYWSLQTKFEILLILFGKLVQNFLIYGENRELVEVFGRVYLNTRTKMALSKKIVRRR